MRLEPDVVPARSRARSRYVVADDNGWIDAFDRSGRHVALVIAEAPLAAAVGEVYRANGYDVFVPATPLDAIHRLVSVGDRIGAVVISPTATWATGLHELLAEEFPEIDRVMLAA